MGNATVPEFSPPITKHPKRMTPSRPGRPGHPGPQKRCNIEPIGPALRPWSLDDHLLSDVLPNPDIWILRLRAQAECRVLHPIVLGLPPLYFLHHTPQQSSRPNVRCQSTCAKRMGCYAGVELICRFGSASAFRVRGAGICRGVKSITVPLSSRWPRSRRILPDFPGVICPRNGTGQPYTSMINVHSSIDRN